MNPHIQMNGELGGKAHIVFYIAPEDADAALENLRRHQVTMWGPRYNDQGEMHIDFEDPDGQMLEFWSRKAFQRRGRAGRSACRCSRATRL